MKPEDKHICVHFLESDMVMVIKSLKTFVIFDPEIPLLRIYLRT